MKGIPLNRATTNSTGPCGKGGTILLHLFLWAISVPLLGAFWVQFVWNEAPCPLCLLQRMCMIVAGLGVVWILSGRTDSDREVRLSEWSRGFAISVLAATLGLSISLRQILLHIAPDDPGFGTPILTYHLYTWAFVIFVAVLLCSGACLLFARSLAPANAVGKMPQVTRVSVGLFGLLILANALIVSYSAVTRILAAGDLP